MNNISMRFVVSGMVQGVGFRYHTCYEGLKRNLTGYAKNLDNGDVEVIATGNEKELESLHQWLAKGPKSSRVDGVVKYVHNTQEFKGFEIKY